MTSCILMSRSSSVAADTASFTGETKAGMRTRVAVKTGSESMSLLLEECHLRTRAESRSAAQTLQSGHTH